VRHTQVSKNGLAIAAAALALALPGVAQATDLRSPDARDAALAAETARSTQGTDLRSPDTRDAAEGVRVITVTPRAPQAQTSFQWDDAGFGAGAAFLIVLMTGGIAVAVHRRHRTTGGSRGPGLATS
jgi:hypothetical protein